MNPNRAFGVGCFHFGYRKAVPYRFSASDYVTDVKKALSSLSSLSELDVSFFEELCEPFDVSVETPTLFEDGDYFPGVLGLAITFTLFIPFRVQSELFPNESVEMQQRRKHSEFQFETHFMAHHVSLNAWGPLTNAVHPTRYACLGCTLNENSRSLLRQFPSNTLDRHRFMLISFCVPPRLL